MSGRSWQQNSDYRYGFNGKEGDSEIKGQGNSYDFGARIYDSRIGRWLSLDPLEKKYPSISPYVGIGNNPIQFVDFGGNDFGVKINHTDKTIIIVANVYTTNSKAYSQALRARDNWNNKKALVDGYTVSFQITVKEPPTVSEKEVVNTFTTVNFYRKNGKLRRKEYKHYSEVLIKMRSIETGENDEIGNTYTGDQGLNSKFISSGLSFTGGITYNGRRAEMNHHHEYKDLGDYPDLVTHEFGHFFGLDDKDGDNDGITDKYFPGEGGIMEYQIGTLELKPISDNDVKTIINYAKDALEGNTDPVTDAKVKLLENIGTSDGTNPLGIKGEKNE